MKHPYPHADEILDLLQNGPMNFTAIRVALGYASKNLRDVLVIMERRQQVARVGKEPTSPVPGPRPTIWAVVTPQDRIQRDISKARALLERYGYTVARAA